MPGGRGKAKRLCPMCKPYKFAGNSMAKGGGGRYKEAESELRSRTDIEMRSYPR